MESINQPIVDVVHTPLPTLRSAPGTFGPLCGAVERGEYYWSSLTKTLEVCPEEATGDQWLTLVLGAAAVMLASVIHVYRAAVDEFLARTVGKRYTTPIGVIRFTFANGRFKVLWTTFSIITSISWALNIDFPYPFDELLDFLSFIQLTSSVPSASVSTPTPGCTSYRPHDPLIPVGLAASSSSCTWPESRINRGGTTPAEQDAARAEATQQHTSAFCFSRTSAPLRP